MRVLALGCVVVVGCSSVFGLGGSRDDDLDGDRIPDDLDNCKDVPNPDQSDHDHNGIGDRCDGCASPDPTDSDGDGIPDACDGCDNTQPDDNGDGVPDACEQIQDGDGGLDPCPGCSTCAIGPRHDEDHDLTPDGCDFCPAVVSVNVDDGDFDGVGDKCDPDGAKSYQIFDPLLGDSGLWAGRGQWEFGADQVSIMLGNGSGYLSLGAVGGPFLLRTRITAASGGPLNPAKPGLYAADNQNPALATELITCSLSIMTFGNSDLVASYKTKNVPVVSYIIPLPSVGPWTLVMQVGKGNLNCQAVPDGVGVTPFVTPDLPVTFTGFYPVGLAATGAGVAAFDYYDLVSTAP